jgi:hypothetical protein
VRIMSDRQGSSNPSMAPKTCHLGLLQQGFRSFSTHVCLLFLHRG